MRLAEKTLIYRIQPLLLRLSSFNILFCRTNQPKTSTRIILPISVCSETWPLFKLTSVVTHILYLVKPTKFEASHIVIRITVIWALLLLFLSPKIRPFDENMDCSNNMQSYKLMHILWESSHYPSVQSFPKLYDMLFIEWTFI